MNRGLPTCFVCGKEVILAERVVVAGLDRAEHAIRLHQRCATRLAADVLEALHAGKPNGQDHGPQHRRAAARVGLSPTEQRVLERVATGCTNEEIARDLAISMKTARNAVSGILGKLDARTRAEAVAIAVREGLLE